MAWSEKAGSVEFVTPNYTWSQTIDEVNVSVPLPPGTRARALEVVMKPTILRVTVKGDDSCKIDGKLFGRIDAEDSFWTVEDGELKFMLTKVTSHQSWKSLIQGEHQVDPMTHEEMDKKMMLEKFQNENPGFDFSGASFSGSVPSDPKNFMKFD